MSIEIQLKQEVVLTASVGTNADLMPHIFELYVPEGSRVADVTFGKGVFWHKIDPTKYDLLASDLMTGVDFRDLPYEDRSNDCLVLDPPYMHGGKTVHKNINACYQNGSVVRGHESIVRLYASGILEAARTLRPKGIIIVKCQDEIEGGKQRWSHMEIVSLLEMFGFEVIDLFVLVQTSIPVMRQPEQQHARKNHSYALVARFQR
jgi:tRNA G10  N-methylase Trm11